MGILIRWLLGRLSAVLFDRTEATRQMTLLWTLAVAVEKQLPVGAFLEALADEAGGDWRWKVRGLAELLAAGASIPDAIEAMPGVLPRDTVAMIRVGATTGNLSGALREGARLARRRSESTGMRFQGTVLYLYLLLFALGLVASFILIWIIPKFKFIFAGFDVKLPNLTQVLISAGDSGLGIVVCLFPLVMTLLWMALSYSLEVIGWAPAWSKPMQFTTRLLPRFKSPHVLRCLSIAVDGGRPLSDALNTLAGMHPDIRLRLQMMVVAEVVASGDDCWHALCRARMLNSGEAAMLEAARRVGNLAWALRGMADGIERRFEYRCQLMMEFVHPAVVVATGAVIGLFCVAIFLPLIELLNKLS